MRKILMCVISALVVFLLSSSAVYGADDITVETAFPDSAFRSVVCEKVGISDVSDSISQWQESISSIRELSASGRKIKSILGIEYFTSLEILDVSINDISELDLSANGKLKILLAYENPLVDIDLSENTDLIYVYAQNCELSSITLPSFVERVYLQGNKIRSAEFSYAVNLQELNLRDNNLMDIDLSENNNLKYLWLGGNKLEDVSLNKDCSFEVINLGTQIYTVGRYPQNGIIEGYAPKWDIISMNRECTESGFSFTKDERSFILVGKVSVDGYEMAVTVTVADMSPDINKDFVVNSSDLSDILSFYGTSNTDSDINNDGVVNSADLSWVLSSYGVRMDR